MYPRYGFAEPKARSRARASTLRWCLENVWDKGARQLVRELLSHYDNDPAHKTRTVLVKVLGDCLQVLCGEIVRIGLRPGSFGKTTHCF